MTSTSNKFSNFVNQLYTSFVNSSDDSAINKMMDNWQNILIAIFMLLFGWFLSWIIKIGIIKASKKIRLDDLIDRTGFVAILKKARINSKPSELIGNFAQAWIVTVFLMWIAEFLKLSPVSSFFSHIMDLLPDIAIAILIVLVAVRFGDFVGNFVAGALSLADSHAYKVVSMTARSILITIGILAALNQLEIGQIFINTVFIGFVAMLSLAGGLAFGLGGKDVVRDMLKELTKKKK